MYIWLKFLYNGTYVNFIDKKMLYPLLFQKVILSQYKHHPKTIIAFLEECNSNAMLYLLLFL